MKRHTAGEDYLEAILVLQQEKDVVRSIDVARHLGFSRASVSVAVSVLKDAGLLEMNEKFNLLLTDEGRKIAEKIYERHCFFKNLLMFSGVEEKDAEDNACRLEHVITDDAFLKLKQATESLLK